MMPLQERARRARERALIRAWEYRQRNHSHGVWFRLRRVLVDAGQLWVIDEREADRLEAPRRALTGESHPARAPEYPPGPGTSSGGMAPRSTGPESGRDLVDGLRRQDGEAFKEAYAVFERRHVLRMDDPPEWERLSLELFESDHRVYDLMTGGAEFPTGRASGEFDAWDVRPRLGEITPPTLLLSGRYDEATPAVMRSLNVGIPQSEWHILEESSHSCHTEEETRTLVLVADFLARVEAGVPVGRTRKE